MENTCEYCKYARTNDKFNVSCHRYPPTVTGSHFSGVNSDFPLVSKFEWCGEFKKADIRCV